MSRELCHPFQAYADLVRQLLQAIGYSPAIIAVYDTVVQELADSIEVSFQHGAPSLADIANAQSVTITVCGENYQQQFHGDVGRLAAHVFYAQLYHLFTNTAFKNLPVPAMSMDFNHPLAYAQFINVNLDHFVWHNGYVCSGIDKHLFQFDYSENQWASKTGYSLTQTCDLAYMRNDTEIGFLKGEGVISLKGLPPDATFRVINGWNIFRDQPIETIQSIGRTFILNVPNTSSKEQE